MQHLSKETAAYLVRCHIESVTSKTPRSRRNPKRLPRWAIAAYMLVILTAIIIIALNF